MSLQPHHYKARLLKLADLLQNLPRKRFDFGTFGNAEQAEVGCDLLAKSKECGTTACALGWAPSLPFARKHGASLRMVAWDMTDFFVGEEKVRPDEISFKLFGLTEIEHNRLFIPRDEAFGGYSGLPETATPKQVAKHIRKFVKNKYG